MTFRHQPLLFVALLSHSAACNAPPSSTVDASVASDSGTHQLAVLTVTVPPVAIAALAEVTDEFCLQLGNRDALFVTGFELRAGPYLHHTQTRFASLGSTSTESWIFGTSTGSANISWALPIGSVMRIPADAALCLGYHFVNTSDQPVKGEASLRLHAVPFDVSMRLAGLITMQTQLIDLAPASGSRATFECQVTLPVEIFAAAPHVHRRGTRMTVIRVGGLRDGEVVTTWDDLWDVAWRDLSPPVVLAPGEGLRVHCDYQNNGNDAVGFGINADSEMCVLTAYYWPGPDTLSGTETGQGCILRSGPQ